MIINIVFTWNRKKPITQTNPKRTYLNDVTPRLDVVYDIASEEAKVKPTSLSTLQKALIIEDLKIQMDLKLNYMAITRYN